MQHCTKLFRKFPSRDTTERRITAINTSLEYNLKNDLKNCIAFSLALDESTDITDLPQLAVSIHFVSPDFVVKEELLDLVALQESTRDVDIKNALDSIMKTFDVPLNKLVSIATDGAPAMLGVLQLLRPALALFHARRPQRQPQLRLHQLLLRGRGACSRDGPRPQVTLPQQRRYRPRRPLGQRLPTHGRPPAVLVLAPGFRGGEGPLGPRVDRHPLSAAREGFPQPSGGSDDSHATAAPLNWTVFGETSRRNQTSPSSQGERKNRVQTLN
ncbi:hypothetical protein J437_LFUL017605 [Ladona fulva]|uniref:DUF4371 domain-containing protein n=1 Tax=Ladona fulva TaxID=123851 RepID=A0A8K0KVF1_LADFU|nr:hypothetical protein J437_LFUL017605 [Ladona fulva]